MTPSRSLLFVLMSSGLLLCTASRVQTQATPDYKVQIVSPHDGLRVQTDTAGGQVGSFGGSGEFDIDAPGFVGGRLSVKENGHVGIGTPFPDELLTVDSFDASTNALLSFQQGRVTAGYAGLGQDARLRLEALPGTELRVQSDDNAKPMTFYHNNVERMRISGTRLSVAGTIQGTAGSFMFPDGSVQSSAAVGPGPTDTTTLLLQNSVPPGLGDGTPIVPFLQLFNLTPGTYRLSATVDLHNLDTVFPATTDCVFSTENFKPHRSSFGPSAHMTVSFDSIRIIPSNIVLSSVNVSCDANGSNVVVSSGRLTAMKVGTATVP